MKERRICFNFSLSIYFTIPSDYLSHLSRVKQIAFLAILMHIRFSLVTFLESRTLIRLECGLNWHCQLLLSDLPKSVAVLLDRCRFEVAGCSNLANFFFLQSQAFFFLLSFLFSLDHFFLFDRLVE